MASINNFHDLEELRSLKVMDILLGDMFDYCLCSFSKDHPIHLS